MEVYCTWRLMSFIIQTKVTRIKRRLNSRLKSYLGYILSNWSHNQLNTIMLRLGFHIDHFAQKVPHQRLADQFSSFLSDPTWKWHKMTLFSHLDLFSTLKGHWSLTVSTLSTGKSLSVIWLKLSDDDLPEYRNKKN